MRNGTRPSGQAIPLCSCRLLVSRLLPDCSTLADLRQLELARRPKVEQATHNTEDVFVAFKATTIHFPQDAKLL